VGARGLVSRRTLLCGAAAIAASGVAGCASVRPSPVGVASSTTLPSATSDGAPTESSDRDRALAALADEQAVLAAYAAVARSQRRLRARVAPLLAVQRRHIEALVDALGLDRAPAPPPSAPDAGSPAQVGDIASRAARGRLADCRLAASGSLASMLASMSASHRVVAAQWAVT
jgi:hypothetical protein